MVNMIPLLVVLLAAPVFVDADGLPSRSCLDNAQG